MFVSKFTLGLPALITTVTVISGWNQLPSDFSCWLNVGHNVSLGTFIYIFTVVAVTIVVLEASSTTDFKPLILTSKVQYRRALYEVYLHDCVHDMHFIF